MDVLKGAVNHLSLHPQCLQLLVCWGQSNEWSRGGVGQFMAMELDREGQCGHGRGENTQERKGRAVRLGCACLLQSEGNSYLPTYFQSRTEDRLRCVCCYSAAAKCRQRQSMVRRGLPYKICTRRAEGACPLSSSELPRLLLGTGHNEVPTGRGADAKADDAPLDGCSVCAADTNAASNWLHGR